MRKTALFASFLVLGPVLWGCGASTVRGPVTVTSDGRVTEAQVATDPKIDPATTDTGTRQGSTTGTWVGVAPESDVLAAGDGTASIALWGDAAHARPLVRVPLDIALVIRTSRPIGGAEIENARRAAN